MIDGKVIVELYRLVTGKLYVVLDFYPQTDVRLVGAKSEYQEIPTLRSTTDEIADKQQTIPIDQIAAKLVGVLDGIDRLVNAPELLETVRNANAAVTDIRALVRELNAQIESVVTRQHGTDRQR